MLEFSRNRTENSALRQTQNSYFGPHLFAVLWTKHCIGVSKLSFETWFDHSWLACRDRKKKIQNRKAGDDSHTRREHVAPCVKLTLNSQENLDSKPNSLNLRANMFQDLLKLRATDGRNMHPHYVHPSTDVQLPDLYYSNSLLEKPFDETESVCSSWVDIK